MAKKKLLAAAVAFASSPKGRRMIQQAKDYAARPENQAKAKDALGKVRGRTGRGAAGSTPSGSTPPGSTPPAVPPAGGTPPYGTPPEPPR